MKIRPLLSVVLMAALFTPVFVLAQPSDLAVPAKRETTVALAKTLLQPRVYAVSPADAISPFAPPTFDQPDPEELKSQRAAAAAAAAGIVHRTPGDRGVLEQLAEKIVPSGIARLGGNAILLFGQKKLKVGDRLTITFEGNDYDLDITSIGNTNFTLRYNSEEITRSIKPGK